VLYAYGPCVVCCIDCIIRFDSSRFEVVVDNPVLPEAVEEFHRVLHIKLQYFLNTVIMNLEKGQKSYLFVSQSVIINV
jgi:hypothetical protein